jgi:mono/diheme cytochrome c family protein/glucose/arabinose dehydrogenase
VKKRLRTILLFGLGVVCLQSCADSSQTNEGPSPEKSPQEELATFVLEPGLKIQLVAAEPMVQDPVVITFDEDGRLWVVEMRGFMPDIDGVGEKEPVGRISVLEDTDGDGKMDISTIYLDSLIMPRALALVPGGALVVEHEALWLTQDLNNDFQADTKTLLDPDYAGSPAPEHSGNGLWRGMDNWYYNVKSRFRYRLVEGKWQRDSTEFRGQWGLSHDDEGRLFYNYNWSQLHADLVPPNYLSRNKNHTPTTGIDHGLTIDRRIYPIRPNPAINRGYIPGTLDSAGRLLEFTAACSPYYFRGTALPETFYGNVFVCEPSGNLVKRNVVREKELLLSAYDPHPGKEFLASTDERFRPVHLASGPDGALYIADMYRGLIQHGAYVTPYLREQTLSRKLVLPVNRGRIWRIVRENWVGEKPTTLSGLSTQELVEYLSHANGWYRDMAQRLLVESGDENILPVLKTLAQNGDNPLGRLHALWTIEGLGQSDPEILLNLLKDKNQLIRSNALRLLEPIIKKNQAVRLKLENELASSAQGSSAKTVVQVALTAGILDGPVSRNLLIEIANKYDTSALMRDVILSSLKYQEFAFLRALSTSTFKETYSPGKSIFLEMLTTSIVRNGDAAELTNLLAMLDTETFGWQEKAILTGMSIQGSHRKIKPVVLESAPKVFTRKNNKIEPSRLQALATLFEWPGHTADSGNQETKLQLSEEAQQQFVLGRQHYLTNCAGCHGAEGEGLTRFAPPLVGSEWVLGDERRLAMILLHGMEGPVEVGGKVYDAPDILPVMPSHSTMDDKAITSIMTYIRNEWGNQASPVGRRTVGTTRYSSQGRVMPWTANELNQHMRTIPESTATP